MIERASRERPADLVLRETLRGAKLASDGRKAVTAAVFAFYRWRGWLSKGRAPTDALMETWALARRFRQGGLENMGRELETRAVPGWVRDELTPSPAWFPALQDEPPLWIRARRGQAAALARRLGDCVPAGFDWCPEALRYQGEQDLFRTPEFHEGAFEIQDLHSQAVSWLCQPGSGETWWDACAGEGGKTLHLSDLMGNRGLIWATDRHGWRLQHLRRRAARAGVFNYRARVWDGGSQLPVRTRFDGVLVDAPCSNLGTWHRNPHARWTATPQDVRELAALQLRLLVHARPVLKPGGRLVYAVCTMTRAETVDVARQLTERFPELEPLALPPEPSGEGDSGPGRLLPCRRGGGNGMFVAAWRCP